jgi:predicted enzyme related to lactoylglutathione lyase
MIKFAFILLLTAVAIAQEPPPELNVSMVSLGVKDMERAVGFYGETLGLTMRGAVGEVTLFEAGSILIALNWPLGSAVGDPLAGAVEVIFEVESVAASQVNLAKRGCNFVVGAHEVTVGMWAATFTDPDGHRLTILGPR